MVSHGRDAGGRFSFGNPGGPGRPRRAIEREYLATLGEAVSLKDWRRVVARALADAIAGDARARQWLSGYLVNDLSLMDVAASEAGGLTPEDEIADLARKRHLDEKQNANIDQLFERLDEKKQGQQEQ